MRGPYTGQGVIRTDTCVEIEVSSADLMHKPENYIPDDGLVQAVNVALLLGQPLLVTGEPGTGKTDLAESVALELGWGKPLVFDTKSTSVAKDLFYSFDAVGRFGVANSKNADEDRGAVSFLRYNALGRAIILSCPAVEHRDALPPDFSHPGEKRSVVLIDEIDKAPRDFPNDVLAELGKFYFYISELGKRVQAPLEMRPFVIMTSNSEKHLPDAFLRRCVYYHIPFPNVERLREIIDKRMGMGGGMELLLDSAMDFFGKLRNEDVGLRKKPGTAELLGWLIVLKNRCSDWESPLNTQKELMSSTLGVLAKTKEDLEATRKLLSEWCDPSSV